MPGFAGAAAALRLAVCRFRASFLRTFSLARRRLGRLVTTAGATVLARDSKRVLTLAVALLSAEHWKTAHAWECD